MRRSHLKILAFFRRILTNAHVLRFCASTVDVLAIIGSFVLSALATLGYAYAHNLFFRSDPSWKLGGIITLALVAVLSLVYVRYAYLYWAKHRFKFLSHGFLKPKVSKVRKKVRPEMNGHYEQKS
ncbi:MAG: hypothetical protein QG551_203 [Patescibacteria group bacterium]|jgi:membrane protein YdbS with pleckstrin-like domain|nr:hypothetical protein [Patescibacteria group bacterium]